MASFLKPSISFCNCSFSCWSFSLCSLTKALFSLSESRMLCNLQITSWQRDFSSSELKEKKSLVGTQELNNYPTKEKKKIYWDRSLVWPSTAVPMFLPESLYQLSMFKGLTATTMHQSAKNFIKMMAFIKPI